MSYLQVVSVALRKTMIENIEKLIKKHGYRDLSELGRYLFQKWYEEHREE